jgi:flagellin-like hook-associated protein FlgL
MRVVNMVPDMQYAVQQSQQALSTALQQVSTGLRVNQPSDDPGASAAMVISLASSANVDQYTSNVSATQARMQTADSAINSVVTSLNTAVTLAGAGATGTSSAANDQALAAQAQGILSSVISQANTSYQGVYLFAGSASNTPPFVAASTTYLSQHGSAAVPLSNTSPLTAGSVITINDASTAQAFTFTATAGDTIATLASAISGAVAAGTLSAGTTATINAKGELAISSNSGAHGIVVRSTDPVLGSMTTSVGTEVPNAYAYVGDSTVNSVQVGDSTTVASNVPGDQLFTSGANVIGSLKSLISALQSGDSATVATGAAAVSTALNYVSQQRVPLDNTISQLSNQDSFLGQETLTLTTQQTALVGVNLATAATSLSQAELDNTAVLAAASKVLPQTLLNYLAPG